MELVLWLACLCKDDNVFKEEHAAVVFGVLHQQQVPLTQDLAVLTHVALQGHSTCDQGSRMATLISTSMHWHVVMGKWECVCIHSTYVCRGGWSMDKLLPQYSDHELAAHIPLVRDSTS